MCFSSAKSSQSSNVQDERFAAGDGAVAFRADGTNNITVGSDDTAQFAIASSTNALTETTDLIDNVLTKFFDSNDKNLERAQQNINQNQQTTKELLLQEQVSSDDRLFSVIKLGLLAGVSYAAVRSGVVKDVFRSFK